MNFLDWLYDAHVDDRRPPDQLARDRRQRVRLRLGHRRHAPAGVGVAGRHRRQRAAVHRVHRRRPSTRTLSSRCSGQAGRQVFFIVTQRLRLVALAAGQARPRRRGDGGRRSPPLGDRARADRLPGRRRGRRAGVPVAVHRDRRRLAGAALVLLVRRLDLRRLDARDVRDGPRLGRLLARLDRRRPGRRDRCCGTRSYYPTADPVRRLRRSAWSTASSSGCERQPRRDRPTEQRREGRHRHERVRLDSRRAGDRRHRRRQGGRRRRRRGPRERGRHHLRRQRRRRRS